MGETFGMGKLDNPLYHARKVLRFSVAQAAEYLGVSESTIRRQESGKSPVCPLMLRLLTIRAGDLGAIDRRWHGWKIGTDGELYNPLGFNRGFAPGQISALVFNDQLVSALRLKIRKLERRLFLLAPSNDGFYLQRVTPPTRSDDIG